MRLPRLFQRRSAAAGPGFDAPLAPAERLAVVGDIHGCAVLLDRLLAQIDARVPDRVVFVGDYVDRGEDSAAVLTRLHRLAGAEAGDGRALFLKGNHEAMMLSFLDDPAANGGRWLRYGGLQTLASFGIGGLVQTADDAALVVARDALARALGPDMLTWLRALPARFVSGNVAVVHAGADPARPIADQSEQVLLWGHDAFIARTRSDGLWVVHGHTIVAEVAAEDGRIGVDTGAYANGRLSAALIGAGAFEVLTATYH